ncbi:limbic system-associated membrane protein [Eurytemora carolleeae]|uniref:limbic system-associated membrane protein n=1 Tax=Eurytemora carolleeae TaxID=1294199 RepID=UPI000C780122|nr:limbic system-associated membrane protein [Eurytemora carolleeae]|eukprot:XP_023343524.1 limbic system-associated membrane protein-like [Eurytemora affinis]
MRNLFICFYLFYFTTCLSSDLTHTGSQNHSDIRHQHPHPPSPPPSPRPHPRSFRGLDDLHHPPHPPKDQPPHPQLQDSHFLPYQQTKEVLMEPHLDLYYGQNITVEEGAVGELECRVFNLGNRSVSWVRLGDGRIIAVDQEIFTTESRFSVRNVQNVWSLKIEKVNVEDEGLYECQISTNPKSFKVFSLHVFTPKVVISGSPDVYIREGSSVSLECVVRNMDSPVYISWEFQGRTLLGGTVRNHTAVISRLNLIDVKKREEGEYTCLPSMLKPVYIKLHVLGRENSGERGLPYTNSSARNILH